MSIGRLISRTSIFVSRNVGGLAWYSTVTQRENSLYRRLTPLGKPNESIVPLLDEWIEEGRNLTPFELRNIMKELRRYGRFKHALEISRWMSDKRYMHLLASDVAIRLDLIAKVYGIEQAENYFNSTPKQMRTVEVYGALLNCYAHEKCVAKADAIMQQMRELGCTISTISYNVLLNLYCQTGNYEKVHALMHEMEEEQINFDVYTYNILLNASGSGVDGIEKVLKRIESDVELNVDWVTYASVAARFLAAGSIDKALKSLRKSEKLVVFAKKKNEAFRHLLTLYATAGKKKEVLRIWNICKKFKLYNQDYFCMLPSILKFNDMTTAEKILEEWKSSDLSKDIRVPNCLIVFYCKNDLVEKAEALIECAKMENWEKPNATTWFWMSSAYVKSNQMLKALEAMECGLSELHSKSRWKLQKETLVACLKYLKEKGDVNRSSDFVRLLKDKDMISEDIHNNLLAYFSGDYAFEDGLLGNGVVNEKALN